MRKPLLLLYQNMEDCLCQKKGLCRFFVSGGAGVAVRDAAVGVGGIRLPGYGGAERRRGYVVSLGALQEDDVVLYEKNAETTQQPAALVRLMARCVGV